MNIYDTGPIVSAIDKGEKRRHLFAAELLARLGRKVIVPWPVLVETDLLLTWDFRHFRSVVLKREHHWPLLVSETEMPLP